jgi:hypothetical protein
LDFTERQKFIALDKWNFQNLFQNFSVNFELILVF